MSQGSMQVKAAFQFHEPSLCVTARTLLMKSCSFLRQTVLNAEITGAGPSMFTHHNRYNIAQLPSQHFMHSLRLCPRTQTAMQNCVLTTILFWGV